MKKQIFAGALGLLGIFSFAQEINLGGFSGGVESNGAWYVEDETLSFDPGELRFRSNNYFRLDYQAGNVSAGVQYEAYQPGALLGYSPRFEGQGIATYYARYRDDKIDITAGNFYDQFGSGLIYRSWEDRAIGINNSIRGVRAAWTPNTHTTIKGFIGQQRLGFDLVEGAVGGIDVESNIIKLVNKDAGNKHNLVAGASYVGKYEPYTGSRQDIPGTVGSYAARLNYYGTSGFHTALEYVYKGADVSMNESTMSNDLYDGNAFLWNAGYSRRGFGVNTTFRRLENMGMFSTRRFADMTVNTFNEANINYLPALTRQHDYLLTNIYVYQSQGFLNFGNQQAGEIGGQLDVFYNIPRGSKLGGRYGTKIAVNGSYWNALQAEFDGASYTTGFLDFGEKYFHDVNVEVTKKWSPKFLSIITYMNQFYHKGVVEGGNYSPLVANVVVGDFQYIFNPRNSMRFELQHMQSKRERKNWAAALVEYNYNLVWSFYASDLWNYGNDDPARRFHYYNLGAAYARHGTRVAANYGRQRGGLICVGGVCRFVPESAGLTFSINHSF
ncbi:MAG: DUF6029 family protein [Weeksellaceae bacterium]|nr:DUF6029 family protein [Weeksellaceae bacterium]